MPIGRATASNTVVVLDRSGDPVPLGVPGELVIGGAGVARGYLNRPAWTAERFVPDPGLRGRRRYRSGDLVRWLAEGEIEFLGRIDHQVKIRGLRIELGEIEAALTRHPAVRQAVVLVRERDAAASGAGDRSLVAYVVRHEAEQVAAGALRAWLGESLPAYMTPSAVVFLDTLPRTATGKVDRNALSRLELPATRRRPTPAVWSCSGPTSVSRRSLRPRIWVGAGSRKGGLRSSRYRDITTRCCGSPTYRLLRLNSERFLRPVLTRAHDDRRNDLRKSLGAPASSRRLSFCGFCDYNPDMATRLRAQIVSIDSSPAVRLPLPVLEQSGLGPEVEIEVRWGRIVIQPPSSREQDQEVSAKDEIHSLYAELRELMVRSEDEPDLEEEMESRFRRLRQLQTAEADAMQAAFDSGRHLAPGRGWRALEKAREILGDEDPTLFDETSES